jgi:hypothetical protein
MRQLREFETVEGFFDLDKDDASVDGGEIAIRNEFTKLADDFETRGTRNDESQPIEDRRGFQTKLPPTQL